MSKKYCYKFNPGDAVEMTMSAIKLGLDGSRNARKGTVVRVSKDGSLVVKRMTYKTAETWHATYWRHVEE